MNYKYLSDINLEETLKNEVIVENKQKTKILHLLAEIERRRMYSKNYPSLFEYCVKVLKYSAASAQRRIDTMRAMKLIPELEQKIITGELNLSSIAQAQSFFRHEAKAGKNYSLVERKEVLGKLENKSSRECVQELIAISPQSIPQEKRRELTLEKTELKVVLNKELIKKLDKIKALMSHKNPNMTDQELIEVMAKLVLEKIDPIEKAKRSVQRKAKSNATLVPPSEVSQTKEILETSPEGPRPERKRVSPNPRYIPSSIKQEVYMRDKGQCTHPNCNSTHYLEYDHITPVALSGKSTVQNLRLLCRAHNQRAAINKFGFNQMKIFIS